MGGVNALYAQGTWPDDYCTPQPNCMLLCNPELAQPFCLVAGLPDGYDCGSWMEMTWNGTPTLCDNFPGWRNIYGSPDYGAGTPTDNTQVRMWATDAAVDEPAVCCQRGEGIMAEVNLTPNTPYIFSYIRRIRLKCEGPGGGGDEGAANMMPPGSCTGTYIGNPSGLYANSLDNLYVNLTNYDQITWNTNHYLQPAPANFENILHETNMGDTGWEKVFVCFTPANSWNTLYIYPQQDNCNDLIYAYIDQAHLIQDDFMEMPTLLNATCQEAQTGINIGWECNQMTDFLFTWEYSVNYGYTWHPLPHDQPFITVFPVQPTWYRLTRSLKSSGNYGVFEHPSSDNCINTSVIIAINTPADCCPEPPEPPLSLSEIETALDFQCCLHQTDFLIDQDSPGLTLAYDNMAYTVTATGTWTNTSNELEQVFGNVSGVILVNADIIIPAGIQVTMGSPTLSGAGLQIHFGPRGRIIVEPGGKLILQYGVNLNGACGMWQGIRVLGPGTGIPREITTGGLPNYGVVEGVICEDLKFQNALIGFAGMFVPIIDIAGIATEMQANPVLLCANPFSTNCPTLTPLFFQPATSSMYAINTAGGVVQLNTGNILSCFQGVNLSWYVNNAPSGTTFAYVNRVYFSGGPLLYPFNSLPGATPYIAETGIYGEGYQRLTLQNNVFDAVKYGIRGFEIDAWRISENSFSHCAVGVSAATTAVLGFAQTLVQSNNFTHCTFAIQNLGSRLITKQNTITGFATAALSYGIAVVQSRFNIFNDNISQTAAGLVIMNSKVETNIAHENLLTDNFIGAWLIGNNNGSYLYCNQFYDSFVAIALADDIATPIDGELEDQGDCPSSPPVIDDPADNLFWNSATWDIRSVINDDFDYVHRPVPALTPTISNAAGGVVTPVSCGTIETVDCETWHEIPEEEIAEMTNEKQADKLLVQKFWRYMTQTHDTLAAYSLLESVNTATAKRMKIAQAMQQTQYNRADSIAATLPPTSVENQYYRQLLTLQTNLAQTNRHYKQLTATENALLQQIAQSHTAAAIDAKILRYLAYGEEILVQLPPLPDDLTEGMPIQFKNGAENTDLINLYPNPATNQLQVQYRLPHKQEASLEIYNTLGKCVYRQHITHTGNLHLHIADWASGMYYYRLVQDGKTVVSNKLMVVQH